MSRRATSSKARIRAAVAKAQDITRRQKDLDTCLVEEHKVALAAALAEDYAALLTEYPDVFTAPPVQPEQIRAHARELREAQAALEAQEAESAKARAETEEARRSLDVALHELARSPEKPQKPS